MSCVIRERGVGLLFHHIRHMTNPNFSSSLSPSSHLVLLRLHQSKQCYSYLIQRVVQQTAVFLLDGVGRSGEAGHLEAILCDVTAGNCLLQDKERECDQSLLLQTRGYGKVVLGLVELLGGELMVLEMKDQERRLGTTIQYLALLWRMASVENTYA